MAEPFTIAAGIMAGAAVLQGAMGTASANKQAKLQSQAQDQANASLQEQKNYLDGLMAEYGQDTSYRVEPFEYQPPQAAVARVLARDRDSEDAAYGSDYGGVGLGGQGTKLPPPITKYRVVDSQGKEIGVYDTPEAAGKSASDATAKALANPLSDSNRFSKLAEAYSQVSMIQAQAYADGKKELGDQYEAMKGLMETNIRTEAAAIGKNADDLLKGIDGFSAAASKYVEQDIEAQKALREQFKKDTSQVIPTFRKALDYSTQRADEIARRGGLTPEAAAVISKTQEGLKQARVKFDQSESLRPGSAGRTSRRAGFDIEAVKALAEVDASLRASGAAQATQYRSEAMQTANALQGSALQQKEALKDTSAMQRLTLAESIYQQKQQVTAGRGAQELALAQRAGAGQEALLGARQAADMALTQGRAEQRSALTMDQAQTQDALTQRIIGTRTQLAGLRGGVAVSIADVMNQAAGRYGAAAQQSMQSAAQGFGTAVKTGAGAYMGSQGLLDPNLKGSQGAAAGAMWGGAGMMTPGMVQATQPQPTTPQKRTGNSLQLLDYPGDTYKTN